MRNFLTVLFILFLFLPARVMAQPSPMGPVGASLESIQATVF